MSEQNPKKMSVTQLTLLTAINMMGSGIVMLPTKLAEIGTISILSWVITAFGSLCLAYAFAKCGMFSKRPGMGGYAEYAFGKAGNFLANYTYGISLLFANIAIALTCVGYGSELLGISLSPVNVCLSTIASSGSARPPTSWVRPLPASSVLWLFGASSFLFFF